MRFGSLVGNEKGVEHAFVCCEDCEHCLPDPIPYKYRDKLPCDFVSDYHCAVKSIPIDDMKQERMCSRFEKSRVGKKDHLKEYYVTFSGHGHIVVTAHNEDEAAEIAEDQIDNGDFDDVEIEDVEDNA